MLAGLIKIFVTGVPSLDKARQFASICRPVMLTLSARLTFPVIAYVWAIIPDSSGVKYWDMSRILEFFIAVNFVGGWF
jgi:hypothetical protein